jgi:hypothetical protein
VIIDGKRNRAKGGLMQDYVDALHGFHDCRRVEEISGDDLDLGFQASEVRKVTETQIVEYSNLFLHGHQLFD